MKPGTVLITGAGSGIGRSAALALAREGWLVFATARREEPLRELQRDAGNLPIECLLLDVCDRMSIERARAEVERRTRGHGLDALINNAGYGQFGPIEEVSDKDVRAQFETNVFGLLAVTRAFVPRMRERGSGRVVNISSVAGRIALPTMGVYNASKFAVEAISDALRRELAPFGVQVVLIEPGVIRTGFKGRAAEESSGYAEQGTPYGNMMKRFKELADEMDRVAPDTRPVDRVILKAVSGRRPRARYVTPFKESMLIGLAGLAPTWLVDRVLRYALK